MLTLIISMLIIFQGCGDRQGNIDGIIEKHLRKYPEMEIQDLYKLVHHAAMGGAHMGTDRQRIRDYLVKELESLEPSADEPLLEEVSPDGEVVRLNLRRFKAQNGVVEELVDSLAQSAAHYVESRDKLQEYWIQLEKMAASQKIPYNPVQLEIFFDEMREYGFPPAHHSDNYRNKYKPAYRVIARKYLPNLNDR
ncbi:hypothetical protein ISS30_08225 [bacterium]|nr:hypothetical protein [bacterium]